MWIGIKLYEWSKGENFVEQIKTMGFKPGKISSHKDQGHSSWI